MTNIQISAASTKELVDLYNKLTGKNIKKFENRRLAEKRTQEAVDAAGTLIAEAVAAEVLTPEEPAAQQQETKEPAKPPRTTQTGPKRVGLPGPNSRYTGKRIHLLVSENPRRAGTAGHASFALMREGMTYEDYRLKGGRSNDLAWDIAHGYVEMK